jgi:ketosteroid isomerase-like protein
MSQEDARVLGALYDAWNADDLEAALALWHSDGALYTSGSFVGLDPVYRGRDGFRSFWEQMREPWEWLRTIPDRFESAGGRVVALWHFQALGRDGIEVTRRGGHIVKVEDGRVIGMWTYAGWPETLEAAGLRG